MAKHHKSGMNLEDVQEINRALVIRLIRRAKVCARTELAKLTGLKQATITNIVNDLMEWGLVKETGIIEGRKGRRSIGLTLNTDSYRTMGIRLTRNYFTVGLFDLFGTPETILREHVDISEGSSIVLRKIIAVSEEVLRASRQYTVLGIGAAIPGPYVRSEGRMSLMTEFPGWETISIEKELASAFPVPVYLEHDAKAGAIAEWWFSPRRGEHETMIYVAAGQGIGAGIVIDGRLMRGALGIAGEIGHMSIDFSGPRCACGNNGCLEHYCSSISIVREVTERLGDHPESPLNVDSSLSSIAKALHAGDTLACSAVENAATHLGFGLVSVVNALNPDIIVIGDEMAQLGDVLLQTVRRTVQNHVLPSVYRDLRIELSKFETDPVLIGVSTLAVEHILHRPTAIPRLTNVEPNSSPNGWGNEKAQAL